MSRRSLSPEDEALWRQVSATVRALPGRVAQVLSVGTAPARAAAPARTLPSAVPVPRAPVRGPGETLDRSWDRRLATGTISPDRTLDLHGHTLATAHAALDAGLERAIRSGDRVVLLVTGRPPRRDSERPHARGAIRGHIADWIALSRHAGRIAAVRPAHPRHGGQGALYVILRRPGR